MTRTEVHSDFLPDFCGMRMVFAVLVLGELLAFLLVLTPFANTPGDLRELAVVSLFVQWVGLLSIGCLCVSRHALALLPVLLASVVSLLIVLAVTFLLSEFAYRYFLPRLFWSMGLDSVGAVTPVWRFDVGPAGLGRVYPVMPDGTPVTAAARFSRIEFILRNLAISGIVGSLALRYFFVQHQSRVRMESETNARIQALQSRIRPHFLFNSMNTIASLTRTDPRLAEQVTEDLAALFRVSLSDARVPVTLAEEVELATQYLRIEQQRLGERLQIQIDMSGLPQDAALPALSIQPLVENAVYHGVEPSTEAGLVELRGQCLPDAPDRMQITIRNTLPVGRPNTQRRGHSMAQANVRERLQAFFGPGFAFSICRQAEHYTVRLVLPVRARAPRL